MYESGLQLAERKWSAEVIPYLKKLYEGHWLPSHDILHHRRVWQNACSLMEFFPPDQILPDPCFEEKLFLACLFHDVGLLEHKGVFHGKYSRKQCEKFLSQTKQVIQFDPFNLYLAIEKHDDKNYEDQAEKESFPLKTVLSLADDMDAFGAIGVYRYIEIYLLRGMEMEKIAESILQNAAGRYANLVRHVHEDFVKNGEGALAYKRLAGILDSDAFSETPESLVKWINKNIVELRLNPFDYFQNSDLTEIKSDRIRIFAEFFVQEL